MALESISGDLIKSLAKEAYKLVQKLAGANNKNLKIDERNIEEAITQHINKVNNFTSEISFRELNEPKSLFSVYIPLDLSLKRIKIFENEAISESVLNKKASEVIEDVFVHSKNNIVLIGAPGSGKTTTLKYICQKLLTEENYLGEEINFPLLVRLREDEILANQTIPLYEYILNIFGIVIENKIKCVDPSDDKRQIDAFKKIAAIKLLNQFSPLLVLDGIDEVSDEVVKTKLLKNINEISLTGQGVRFILTTRKGDDLFHIEKSQTFELAPLNDEQIIVFTKKWLGIQKYQEFLSQLSSSSVSDSAKRPLTLSHLCAIFENEGRIPEKSRSIYRKIVNLLILAWNTENQINRTSKFVGFDPDRKKEFLENLAFELSVHFNKSQFSTSDLEKSYRNLHTKFGLPLLQMPEVINEIQVHNGLITQLSYDKFEFAHKSFQEYLSAEHIVKLPKLPVNFNLLRIPSEMALAVNLSSESTEYLACFIEEVLLKNNCDFGFIKSFFQRILIEKPEFLESWSLGDLILKLEAKYCNFLVEFINNKANNSRLNVWEENFESLEDAFANLVLFRNIKHSVESLGQYYKAYEEKIGAKEIYRLSLYRTDLEVGYLKSLYVTSTFFKSYLSKTTELGYVQEKD